MAPRGQIIDLTHALKPGIPSWDGGCGFDSEVVLDYKDCTTDVKFRVQKIKMCAGIGTHMDAPAHCIAHGKSIAELDLRGLFAPCVVIDVSRKAHERYSVLAQDIEEFEKNHGIIPSRSMVIVRTGWERFWKKPMRYRNNLIFPSMSKEAALFLLEREIVGLGIDTLSPDRQEDGYPVHAAILGAGKYIVENVANSGLLPPVDSCVVALPIKTFGGTEAPVRLVALLGD